MPDTKEEIKNFDYKVERVDNSNSSSIIVTQEKNEESEMSINIREQDYKTDIP